MKTAVGTNRGFTLIELMISMAILVTSVLFSLYILSVSQQMSEEARGRLLALNAARSTLEAVKDTPLTSLGTINTNNFIPAELTNGAIQILTNPAALAGVQLATVTVRVTWNGPQNAPMLLEVSTMRSRF